MSFFNKIKPFPIIRQLDAMDCGPTCLRIILQYYGRHYSLPFLRDRCYLTREGVSMLGISKAAESLGMRTLAARLPFDKLAEEAPLPCIAHWSQRHFVVVYDIKKGDKVYVSDPAHGKITYTKEEFLKHWAVHEEEGVVLFLETTPDFDTHEDDDTYTKTGFKFLFSYLFNYKKFLVQLIIGMLLGSLLGLILPFLTQALVDFGINNQDIGFVYTVLAAQLMLFFSRTSVEFIRSWILLHLGTRINIAIISDFLIKLMRLPLSFFDTKHLGDLLQRIGDHRRIENFLTSQTLNVLFSMINLFVFGIVLAVYSMQIFFVFLVGSVMSFVWIALFLKKRRDLDYKRFNEMADNQTNLVQLITGMPEIKLNNCEQQKRWEWEHIQAKLFKINHKGLAINQYQQAGSLFFNQGKDIIISFLAAKEVIDGNMTLGMMMAVTYITGQLSAPIEQLLQFIQTAQDAKLSLERMGEIHNREDEEDPEEAKLHDFSGNFDIKIENLDFHYEGPHSEKVLDDVSILIPHNKTTAIVGASGSGKTTMLKLLLKFYPPTTGEIKLGGINLSNYGADFWRQNVGTVMQEGFLFNDTIARNVALGDDRIDYQKLMRAVDIANIKDFIEALPLAYNTKIGQDGHGLSVGQKQRILIARAVYKDPQYIFFDEATSALDANNEKTIMENLDIFFQGRTVVVVAHRLSTVKNADQILVLDRGKIVELGDHESLTKKRGYYYNLVKNQLELGN